jgi:hypothetical protein
MIKMLVGEEYQPRPTPHALNLLEKGRLLAEVHSGGRNHFQNGLRSEARGLGMSM